ncbi:MAG: hypothetical protein ACJ76H_17090 [Bacteriovoracaceae bacterium]
MRPVLVFFILVGVLLVGLPFGPSDEAYLFMRKFGLDVSMAPITVDTSMMTDELGRPSYDKSAQLRLFTANFTFDVNHRKLDFYLHKIPLHHYYEFRGYGQEMPEGSFFLCKSLAKFFPEEALTGFSMVTNSPDDKGMGFNEIQRCP